MVGVRDERERWRERDGLSEVEREREMAAGSSHLPCELCGVVCVCVCVFGGGGMAEDFKAAFRSKVATTTASKLAAIQAAKRKRQVGAYEPQALPPLLAATPSHPTSLSPPLSHFSPTSLPLSPFR